MPRTESCVISDGPIAMVPFLHKGIIETKRKLRAWTDQKCIPLVSALTALTCAGRQNIQSRLMRYRAKSRKLRKLGRTYRHGAVLAPRKYLCQKEAAGMERPEMYSASRCNNPTYIPPHPCIPGNRGGLTMIFTFPWHLFCLVM